MKTALIPLAQGFEEIEAITIIDVLRRAGVEVSVASLSGDTVEGAHKLKVKTDTNLEKVKSSEFDAIIFQFFSVIADF